MKLLSRNTLVFFFCEFETPAYACKFRCDFPLLIDANEWEVVHVQHESTSIFRKIGK